MSRSPSNVGDIADDKKGFTELFWQRLCQKYRYLKTNVNPREFIFHISDIRLNVNEERGLGIDAYGEQFVEDNLRDMERAGLIELIHDRRFRLTRVGIEYCKNLSVIYG